MKEKAIEYFKNDRFAASNGISLVDCKPGYAKAEMEVTEKHHNSVGTVQGGAIFTLADFAFAAASNAYGAIALAVNVSISFFGKTSKGILTAEAKEISKTNKLATYDVNVYNSENTLVANFKGMAYITTYKNPLSENEE